MKFAPIIAVDEENRCWRIIGVMAVNHKGYARIRIARQDRLVRRVQYYAEAERVNDDLAEGEVTFYRRDPDELASHVEHLRTDDPQFIEKYGAELAAEGKWLRLGAVRKRRGEDVEAVLDNLLAEVRQMTLAAAS